MEMLKIKVVDDIGLSADIIRKEVDEKLSQQFLNLVMSKIATFSDEEKSYLGTLLTSDTSALIPVNKESKEYINNNLCFFIVKKRQDGLAEKVLGSFTIDIFRKEIIETEVMTTVH